MMSKSYPSLVSVAVSPGFVETEMVKSYRGNVGSSRSGGVVVSSAPVKLEYTWMSCWKLGSMGYFTYLSMGFLLGI